MWGYRILAQQGPTRTPLANKDWLILGHGWIFSLIVSWWIILLVHTQHQSMLKAAGVKFLIPYLRVYHVENYVIHHHVVLHGGSRSKKIVYHVENYVIHHVVLHSKKRVYHVENYVTHHHVVLHGGSRSKNADLKISLLLLQRSRRSMV